MRVRFRVMVKVGVVGVMNQTWVKCRGVWFNTPAGMVDDVEADSRDTKLTGSCMKASSVSSHNKNNNHDKNNHKK